MKQMALMAVVLLVLGGVPLAAQDLEVELQRIVQRELATGDVKAAIADYRKLVNRAAGPGGNRGVAARALLRLAESYVKLGSAEARAQYERITREFGDQKEAAGAARAGLAALSGGTRQIGRVSQ